MEIPLLQDIVIILGLSVVVILLFQRFKLPTILGFLITGVVAGPYGLGWIKASHEVEILSEIGVILLLFIIGLEFSLKSLAAIKKAVFLGGSIQVFVTVGVAMFIAHWMGYGLMDALFIGFLFSLSSTAIVLNMLQSSNQINSPQGKVSLAILIFQDIIVIPMMLLVPILAGKTDDVAGTLISLGIKTLLVVVLVILAARYIFPRLLYEVAKTRSRELFILTIIVSCFSVAWLTSSIGLSLALGAFIAGLIISESEYSHQATSQVLPFREIFTSFFFVSIGMLLDISFFYSHLFVILGFTGLVFVIKGSIAALAAAVLKYPPRVSFITGLCLFQVGEFAFILSKVGIAAGLMSTETNQYFLAISILSMGITPIVLMQSDRLTHLFSTTRLSKGLSKINYWNNGMDQEQDPKLTDHVIIIGYGVSGRNIARVAKSTHIPYLIIEMNAETVKREKANGEPIIYGDAMSPFLLEHVNIWSARVAVVVVSDPVASKKIVSSIRSLCKTVYIILRTRYFSGVNDLVRLGADEVISEEFETSVEIFTRVLHKYLIPEDQIEEFVTAVRSDNYKMFRPVDRVAGDFKIPNLTVSSLIVRQSDNDIVGKTVEDSAIRQRYGISVLAIQREGDFLTNVSRSTHIYQDDIIYIMGTPRSIADFSKHVRI